MTDTNNHPLSRGALPGLAARYAAERRFERYGKIAVIFSLAFLTFLIGAIAIKGAGAFVKTEIRLEVTKELVTTYAGDDFTLLRKVILHNFSDAQGRLGRKEAYNMIAVGAEEALAEALIDVALEISEMPATFDLWLPASDDVDMANKAELTQETLARGSPQAAQWLQKLSDDGRLKKTFNTGFLVNGDSRDPERAGIGGAFIGSLFTLFVCLTLSFTIGIFAAIYLEEFAPKNKLTTFLEVNINNLATVPSIIFGLLGLAVFLNYFGLPRSSSLAGGMVLSLMTLPTIIIASRVSLQAVPPSIKEAALAIGTSKIQAVFHHMLPLAMPGMLTGTILGMARALGETAPLMMIGMVAFIADAPGNFTDPATALPVQVYLWADSPERAFAEKTAGAILVLIFFLVLMNLTAIILRKKLEKKW